MKKINTLNSRRSFRKKAVLGSAALGSAPTVLSAAYQQKLILEPRSHVPASFSANESYYKGAPVKWDPDTMKLI